MYVMRSTSTSRTWDIATANTPDGGPSQVVQTDVTHMARYDDGRSKEEPNRSPRTAQRSGRGSGKRSPLARGYVARHRADPVVVVSVSLRVGQWLGPFARVGVVPGWPPVI